MRNSHVFSTREAFPQRSRHKIRWPKPMESFRLNHANALMTESILTLIDLSLAVIGVT